jgi:alcohol dehydrogenase class IV
MIDDRLVAIATRAGLAYADAGIGILTGMLTGNWADYHNAAARADMAFGQAVAAIAGAEHELDYYEAA